MIELTGTDTGLDMCSMPQPLAGEQVPTSNFFQRAATEANRVAISHNTVA